MAQDLSFFWGHLPNNRGFLLIIQVGCVDLVNLLVVLEHLIFGCFHDLRYALLEVVDHDQVFHLGVDGGGLNQHVLPSGSFNLGTGVLWGLGGDTLDQLTVLVEVRACLLLGVTSEVNDDGYILMLFSTTVRNCDEILLLSTTT
jgi:hypothetical protein